MTKKTKNGIRSVSMADFLEIDPEPCPRFTALSKILTCTEIMLNIMLVSIETRQSKLPATLQMKDITALRETIQLSFKSDVNWMTLSKSLGLARNFLRHLPCSTITDIVLFKQKLADFERIMRSVRTLSSSLTPTLKRHPKLLKKLRQTDNCAGLMIQNAKSIISSAPARKRG